jgi:type I restriction enzyme S subunit
MTAFKPLREIITFKGGGTPSKQIPDYWDGAIPWATVKDFVSTSLDRTQDNITEAGLRNSSANLISKGYVIMPTRMSLGKAAINTIDVAINQDLRALIPKIPLDTQYLLHAILSLKDEIVKKGSGATVKGITQEALYNLKVFVPSLDDQKRIAHLLSKVEGLIARRKQHLQQLDDLLKSVFLEMFSPQAPEYPDWPLVEIKDLAAKHKGAMRTGPFGSNLLHNEFTTEGDVAVLGIDNAVQNRFAWGERRFISNEKYQELKSYRIYPGDVIVTIMGTIGRSAVIPNDIPLSINTKHLAAITLNNEIANPLFVSYSIYSSPFILNQFKSKNRGAIMSGLNLGLIKETKLKRPPIELQNQFADIHKKIDEIKSRYQQSLSDLERLYGALSQKAFKGELDLSRVVLPVESTTKDTESTVTHRKTKPLTQGFARQLLAAEILHRHNGRSMTQMKLQKLIHLAEYHAQLDEIQGDYQRQAAGPFDNKMMYGIASGLKKQQWFEMRGRGQNAIYSPLFKAGYHEKYLSHWQEKKAKIGEVLHLLGHVRPDQCEIVSTLYAAWNDLLIDGAEITDMRIIEQASKAELWHKTKEAIDPDRWPKALQWMRDHDLVPTGYGKHTRKLQ